MEVVNPFILKNKERLIVFLDQLSSVTDPFMMTGGLDLLNNSNSNASANSDTGESKQRELVETSTDFSPTKTGPELATLHHICYSHLAELQNMSKINNSIKKLVTVTEMLSKHKLKYQEMIS
jgi:Ras GTPase-activating protein 1